MNGHFQYQCCTKKFAPLVTYMDICSLFIPKSHWAYPELVVVTQKNSASFLQKEFSEMRSCLFFLLQRESKLFFLKNCIFLLLRWLLSFLLIGIQHFHSFRRRIFSILVLFWGLFYFLFLPFLLRCQLLFLWFK